MFSRAALRLALVLFAQGALAQDAPPVVRQIAPDRFQPNPRVDYRGPASAAAIAPPSAEHPRGGCDRAARDYLNCLKSTLDLSTLLLGAAQSRVVASLDQRPHLSASLQRVMAKALADADAKWLELRGQECNQLALLEAPPGAQLYEAQLLCQIRRNMERIDQLASHYGGEAAKAGAPAP